MPRAWTINGRFLTQGMTGVQRYGREILAALDGLAAGGHPLADDLRLEILVPAGTGDLPRLDAIAVRRAGSVSGHLWEQTVLPAMARGGILNLCNTAPLTRRRQIVCVHDVNTLLFPQSYSRAFRLAYRILVPAALSMSAGAATVSRYSAGELERRRLAAPGGLAIAPNGHEHALRWQAETTPTVSRLGDGPTVIVIGSPAPHKNVGMVLSLAPELARHGISVAIAGRLDSRVFNAFVPDVAANNLVWLGGVSDNELAAIYQRSLCLAFPSRAEGFGLPALEAMALGCPVVAADTTSLPEVCGDAALYASPDDPDAWLAAILSIAGDPVRRAHLAGLGRERARLFSWRRSAEIYLDAMAAVDGVQRGSPPAPMLRQDNAPAGPVKTGRKPDARRDAATGTWG